MGRLFDGFFRMVKATNKAALVLIYSVIIVVCFLAVVFRYVLNNSLTWAEELARYLFVALTFLGAAYVVPRNGHVSMDAIYLSLPEKARKVIDGIVAVCTVVFLVYVLRAMNQSMAIIARQRWSSLPLPMRIAYAPMTIGAALSLAYLFEMFVNKIRKQGRLDPSYRRVRDCQRG